jgi:hypothetical protein
MPQRFAVGVRQAQQSRPAAQRTEMVVRYAAGEDQRVHQIEILNGHRDFLPHEDKPALGTG